MCSTERPSASGRARLTGFGLQGDYGLCDFDIPKVVHVSGNYELPFGHGRQFLSNSKGAEEALARRMEHQLDPDSSGRPARDRAVRDQHDVRIMAAMPSWFPARA